MNQHRHQHQEHSHAPVTYNKAFFIAITANSLFVILQIVFSFIANSSSLLADAIHNLGDVLGLVIAWIGMGLIKRKPTEKTTYGMKKSSILAALANAILLVFTCGIIATDAIYKLFYPSEIQALSVMIVAGLGIVVNATTAALFLNGSDDLNIKGAYLHLFYDALVSCGVVVSAALLYWTGWLWLDPVMALIIAFVILKGTWSLFKQSLILLIDGVPLSISWIEVFEFLSAIPGVQGVHDLHIWALSTQQNAMSVHLHMPELSLSDEERADIVDTLEHQFGIQHVTIQIEKDTRSCKDACELICL